MEREYRYREDFDNLLYLTDDRESHLNCVGERLGRVKEEEKLEISLRNRNCRKQWKVGRMNCVVLRETPFGPLKQRR